MTLLAGENITKEFQGHTIIRDLSFSINDGDRIGLVGPNGIGKTTLFEIMAGRMSPDRGQMAPARECRISYLEQDTPDRDRMTLFDYAASARQDLKKMKAEIDAAASELETDPGANKLVEKLGELQHRFELAGGYEFEAELKIILVGLGFPETRFRNRLAGFSGGEKNRASLARLLAGVSNLLLLDEPTNHLDIDSTIWLENYLAELDKAYVIVSHDRAFLSATVAKVWEISGLKIDQYFNGFDNYLAERRDRRRLQEHHFRHQQEEIGRIEDFIRRNMAGQKTKQAQSKQKYLARMKRIELPEAEKEAPSFALESSGRSYNQVLAVEKASFGYGHERLFDSPVFNLYRGDRVGLIGPNGCGKTTLLKTVLGQLEPLAGTVRIGQKVDVAYFDQELAELDEKNTILDELWQIDLLAEAGRLRSFLARFGFRGDDVFKKVAILSGGEKTKLALAKLLFKPANFLIFDEPTNHLDIDARQALEEALVGFNGSCLIVSHDRYFLDRVVEKIATIEDDRLIVYDGNYSFYRDKKAAGKKAPDKGEKDPDRRREYLDFKRVSQEKGRLKKELRSTRSKIKDHEKRLAELEKEVAFNIPKTDWERLAETAAEKARLESALLELYEKLEYLEKADAEYIDPYRKPD